MIDHGDGGNRKNVVRMHSYEKNGKGIKELEDSLYTRLLACSDRLPRVTRRAMDQWWMKVIGERDEA